MPLCMMLSGGLDSTLALLVTVNAFNAIRKKEEKDENFLLGRDESTTWQSPNFKVKKISDCHKFDSPTLI